MVSGRPCGPIGCVLSVGRTIRKSCVLGRDGRMGCLFWGVGGGDSGDGVSRFDWTAIGAHMSMHRSISTHRFCISQVRLSCLNTGGSRGFPSCHCGGGPNVKAVETTPGEGAAVDPIPFKWSTHRVRLLAKDLHLHVVPHEMVGGEVLVGDEVVVLEGHRLVVLQLVPCVRGCTITTVRWIK